MNQHEAPATPRESQEDFIIVDNVDVEFAGKPILQGIDRTIRRGDTVAVIGESGCGKTVFMKTLVALVSPTAGRVLFDGQDLSKLNGEQLAATRRRFGFVFQHAALFDSMSIYDNIAFPIRQNEPETAAEEIDARVRQHLSEVGLPAESLDRFPAELSGGMQKRVGLARALVLKPELIVYDEPTTGLDPIMSDVINELILATRRNYPVTSVVVTHDMHTARKVADRVMMFFPGVGWNRDNHRFCSTVPPQNSNTPMTVGSANSFAAKRATGSKNSQPVRIPDHGRKQTQVRRRRAGHRHDRHRHHLDVSLRSVPGGVGARI